jgi:hypothetical protein
LDLGAADAGSFGGGVCFVVTLRGETSASSSPSDDEMSITHFARLYSFDPVEECPAALHPGAVRFDMIAAESNALPPAAGVSRQQQQ